MKKVFLYLCFLVLSLDSNAMYVECKNGSINGYRTMYSSGKYEYSDDRVTLKPMTYTIKSEDEGVVRITYGDKSIIGVVLNENITYTTVVYQFGGASYMDTIFKNTGKIFSSEHKSILGENVGTTWRISCVVDI